MSVFQKLPIAIQVVLDYAVGNGEVETRSHMKTNRAVEATRNSSDKSPFFKGR